MKLLFTAIIALCVNGLLNASFLYSVGMQTYYHKFTSELVGAAPWIVLAVCALVSVVAVWDVRRVAKSEQSPARDRRVATWCSGMVVAGALMALFSLWAILPWLAQV